MPLTSEHSRFKALFAALSRSSFRSGFRLRSNELRYLHAKGLTTIEAHARDFILKRLAPRTPINDGQQTPMRGHPVFVAQHATACCCRQCLQQWHKIPIGKALSENEQDYIVNVLMCWITEQSKNTQPATLAEATPTLDIDNKSENASPYSVDPLQYRLW